MYRRKEPALWQPNNMSGNDPFGLYSLLPHFKSITHIPKMTVKCLLQQLTVCHDLVHCTVVEMCLRDNINMFAHVNSYWKLWLICVVYLTQCRDPSEWQVGICALRTVT